MDAAAESSPPGARTAAAIWLTKLLTPLKKHTSIWLIKLVTLLKKLTISSNNATPPPVLPISVSTPPTVSPPRQQQQLPEDNGLPPIIKVMREQELGRVIIALAVPVAATVLSSAHGKTLVAQVIVVGLLTGCMAIWNGILFRTTFPRIVNALEQVGIGVVLLSVYGLVASFLPKGLSWVLWVSGAFCLLPFILAPFLRETTEIPS